MRIRGTLLALALLAAAGAMRAEGSAARPEDARARFERGSLHATLAAGWGQGFDWRSYEQDEVRMIAAVPSVGVVLTDPLGGDRWYRGNVDLSLESHVLVNTHPEGGTAAGAAFLLRYQLLAVAPERVVPFVSLGAGIAGLDFDLPHQSDGFSFILQGGAGAHLLWTRHTALTLDARWHHISNAGLRRPNRGLDSGLFLAGITWFFQ